MKTKETTPRIFLTDYASYNNGTQFEFGHWVDLNRFSSADELSEYITEHFKQADIKSPLDAFGSIREEVMITDYEGFPASLYGESMDFEALFGLFEFLESEGIDSLENEDDNLLGLWNEYASENLPDETIYEWDDDTLNMMIGKDIEDAFMAGINADIRYSDGYLNFNGNGTGNIESLSNPSDQIDESALFDWIIETKI